VILSAGAFNTPQLLKLSGIGPKEELERLSIPVLLDLPGVGENLQDRYEVGVVTQMSREFSLLTDCTFDVPAGGADPDSCFKEWLAGRGLYCSNGTVLGVIKKSRPERTIPDLFIFGLPARFTGYAPGYSRELEQHKDVFTWAVLKAHTNNSAGRVSLRSTDPRDVPDINFHYFGEGNDPAGEDLDAVVEGVKFARRLMRKASNHVVRELIPGEAVESSEQIAEFVKNEAWGHHASCTCKMGPRADRTAVVDSRFRVHGTRGLRVVDASVFPQIPGFFIVAAVYMLSEKATDAVLADVPKAQRAVRIATARTRAIGARVRTVKPATKAAPR
jgi:choline dehydrogenase